MVTYTKTDKMKACIIMWVLCNTYTHLTQGVSHSEVSQSLSNLSHHLLRHILLYNETTTSTAYLEGERERGRKEVREKERERERGREGERERGREGEREGGREKGSKRERERERERGREGERERGRERGREGERK